MSELGEARDLCRLLWRKLLRYTRGRHYLESTDERKALNELLALDDRFPWLKDK